MIFHVDFSTDLSPRELNADLPLYVKRERKKERNQQIKFSCCFLAAALFFCVFLLKKSQQNKVVCMR